MCQSMKRVIVVCPSKRASLSINVQYRRGLSNFGRPPWLHIDILWGIFGVLVVEERQSYVQVYLFSSFSKIEF